MMIKMNVATILICIAFRLILKMVQWVLALVFMAGLSPSKILLRCTARSSR